MGLPVHQSTDYVSWLMNTMRCGQGGHVVTLNAEMCIQAETNKDLHAIIQKANLVIPDGAGVQLYFQWIQRQHIKRYPGIEFAVDVLQQLQPTEPVVFYGGEPDLATAAADHWQEKYPDLNVAIASHRCKAPLLHHIHEELQNRDIHGGTLSGRLVSSFKASFCPGTHHTHVFDHSCKKRMSLVH